jgi:hypothetical protein
VKNSLIPRGITINENAIAKLFQDSNILAIEKNWFCDQYFLFVSKSIFGIAPESLDILTIEDIFMCITERFPQLTVNDIQLAFRTHTQEEKVYILTRDIFLKPITEFFRKKNIVKTEIEKELKKLEEEKMRIQKDLEFKKTAKNIYLESIKEGKWLGTEHHANAIGRNFSGVLTLEETDEINAQAKQEHKERLKRAEINGNASELINVPSWQRIYARMYVERMVQRKYKFVEI